MTATHLFTAFFSRHWQQSLLGILMLGFAGALCAQQAIPWNSLSAEQQQQLEKARAQWDQLPAERQQRLLRGAERWSKMSEEERAQAAQRMERWKSLPPKTRQDLNERANRFRELPPEQRERLRELRKDFHSLPEQTQQAFRECQRRQRDDDSRDCRALWPQPLRDKYADLPDPPHKGHHARDGKPSR